MNKSGVTPAPVRLRIPTVSDSPTLNTSYIGTDFSSLGSVSHCRSTSSTLCVLITWNAVRLIEAEVWSVPMPSSVNLRVIGTVKKSARGASLFAPTSVTLFCAMRSGLTGSCAAKSMCRLRSWCKHSLDGPEVDVAGVELSRAPDRGAYLYRQLVVRVEVHLRPPVHVRGPRHRQRREGASHPRG